MSPAALRMMCVLLLILHTAAAPANRTAAPNRNVAVYIIGEPRTLNYTIGSIVRHVLHPLRQARCNVTIFVQTYRCPTVAQYGLLRRETNLPVVITTRKEAPSIDMPCAI